MNSILVIQLKRLGDVILTTPALSELRKLYPQAHITLLLDHHSAAVAPAIADVNEVWIYNRNASFNLWFDLVRRGFDLCLDFTGNDRSALVSFLSKAAQRVGFSFVAKRAARSWGYTHLVQSPVREKHTADHYLDLIRFLGDFVPESGVSLHLTESVERSAANASTRDRRPRSLCGFSSRCREAREILVSRPVGDGHPACANASSASLLDHRGPRSGGIAAYWRYSGQIPGQIEDLQFGGQGRFSVERSNYPGRSLVCRG